MSITEARRPELVSTSSRRSDGSSSSSGSSIAASRPPFRALRLALARPRAGTGSVSDLMPQQRHGGGIAVSLIGLGVNLFVPNMTQYAAPPIAPWLEALRGQLCDGGDGAPPETLGLV
ncbi:MAG: hypothetical protein LC808_42580, partial [Actinobacteria bacterium]|nr:hypothetical protein [Actinomycetota bacterium]